MEHDLPKVNEVGLNEIKEFLAANHKKGGEHFTREMLHAWAADAEFQIGEGNPASIEIRSSDCIHGRTMEYTISADGLDAETAQVVVDEWHFAPAIGGIVHIVDGMRVNVKGLAGHQKLINHFQMLREDGLLTLLRSIDSGHELFHGHDGHVDVYVYRAPAVVPHE